MPSKSLPLRLYQVLSTFNGYNVYYEHVVDTFLYVFLPYVLIYRVSFLKGSPRKLDRKSTRLNSSHSGESRMPSSA